MKKWIFAIAMVIGVQALVLYLYGQPLICTCGYVKLWEGAVLSSGNSQHLTDWYTFSHIIHGFIFYAMIWYFLPKTPVWQRLFYAVAIEAAWELIENTPAVIEHYRRQALAQGYTGDSIINSVSDTCTMILGFLFASRMRASITIGVALALELFTGYMIRDNFTLNIINMIHVFPWIAGWQAGV